MDNHAKCRAVRQTFLPTRLLDLGAFQGSPDVRLVHLELKIPYMVYMALSHCWGSPTKRPIITTKGTLDERRKRISFDSLSRTFQDAIRITRDLGERYIWIDSLCIIQDDEEDWAKEAASMAKVYGGALCTLAALSSEDGTEGCLVNADIQSLQSRYYDLDYGRTGGRVRIFEDEAQYWHHEYGDNPYKREGYGCQPLRSRAWTLQERELSIRNIHFSQNMLLWECLERKGSSQLPWHEVKPQDDFKPWPIRNHPNESLAPNGPVALRDRWYELMEDYSFRSLTKEKDKLPALSGLASKFQEHFPTSQYLAGLWSCHLPAALLWKTKVSFDSQLHKSYLAPSWSWASINGAISYESQRLESGSEYLPDRPEESPADYDFGDLVVKSTNIQPKGADAFGEILEASLVMRARLVLLDLMPKSIEYEDYQNFGGIFVTKDGANAGVLYPDVMHTLEGGNQICCLPIRTEPLRPHVNSPRVFDGRIVLLPKDLDGNELIMGIALWQDPTKRDVYRRIGLVRWFKKSLFKDIEPLVITLI